MHKFESIASMQSRILIDLKSVNFLFVFSICVVYLGFSMIDAEVCY